MADDRVYLAGYGYVIPIKDRNGHILYYADPVTGNRLGGGVTGPGSGNTTNAADAQRVARERAERQSAGATTNTNTPYSPGTPTRNPYVSDIYVIGRKGTSEYDAGSVLLSTVGLPGEIKPTDQFAWDITYNDPTQDLPKGTAPRAYYPDRHQQLTEMTMAGALSWLRNLAVTSPTQYNEIVYKLVAAQYLTPGKARYGTFTTAVGNAFLQSAADVWAINQDEGVGQLTTWGNLIDSLIQGGIDSGQIDPDTGLPISGSGGSAGPKPPTRVDKFSDPKVVKANGNSASKSILGRDLNDHEQEELAAIFHSAEQVWNDEQYAAQLAQFNGQSATVHDAPAAGASALNFVKTDKELAPERTEQLLGSYLGVLRQMTGLGSGGIADAVA